MITIDQALIYALIVSVLFFFIQGRLRYDVVAFGALMAAVCFGVVPMDKAFTGFGHPAVITVVAVLIITRALKNSGIVHLIINGLKRIEHSPNLQMIFITFFVALCSAFMNNVGALALLLPVILQFASHTGRSPSEMLMPLAFGSLLGGLVTLIGTPPNIIIANYREQLTGEPFRMFDFAYVGLGVSIVGLLYVALIGWRFLPVRIKPRGKDQELFEIGDFLTEVRVTSKTLEGYKLVRDLERLAEGNFSVVALMRKGVKNLAPSAMEKLDKDDVLVLEGGAVSITQLIEKARLEPIQGDIENIEALRSDEVSIIEAVVMPGSMAENRMPKSLLLHRRYAVNLLGIARQGTSIIDRLGSVVLRPGDVLLLQGNNDALAAAMPTLGMIPLAQRDFEPPKGLRPILRLMTFAAAIGATALGVLPPQISFCLAVLVIVTLGKLPLREAYNAIEWPIVVLLGALIPVGQALQTTGGTALIAETMLHAGHMLPIAMILALVVIGTMLLSDVINNAATAVIMAPIAVDIAKGVGLPIDPFLMAVAIGSSCTFLTPIGHQSNTLVMGPGGYQFKDYWRMGLPLGILVVATSVPLILYFWMP